MITSLLSYRQNPNVTILVVACLLGPFLAAIHLLMGGDDFIVRALYGVVLWMMAADVLATIDHAARLGDDKVRNRIAKGLYNATYFLAPCCLCFIRPTRARFHGLGLLSAASFLVGGWPLPETRTPL